MLEDKVYYVWLSFILYNSPKKRMCLLKRFKTPHNVWNADREEILSISGFDENLVKIIKDVEYREKAVKVVENSIKKGIKIVTFDSEDYPRALREIYDPPLVLFYKGKLPALSGRNIAIVGARRASSYGRTMAEHLSCELSRYGFNIISGMARGIDTYAHKGALNGGGFTVAVLGSGVDVIYPYENKLLYNNIIENGSVVSEYLPGTSPLSWNFPRRNRIISGMSDGVIVIEAGEKSGSLITANLALEQGREVFSVPGNANSLNSVGTNKLIKEGAKIVTCVEDILEELCERNELGKNIDTLNKKLFKNPEFNDLTSEEAKLVDALVDGPKHIDEIKAGIDLDIGKVSSMLLILELKGIIEQMPGKYFRIA